MKTRTILLLALALATAACAMEVEGEDEPGLDESEIIAHNKLTTEAIVLNSLTGSATAINVLIDNPLATATFQNGGVNPDALKDPNAAQFATYLAQCALTTTQSFSFTGLDNKSTTFGGLHGLCPAWADGPVTNDIACQEIVSACILTRNNALGDQVRLSMLGKTIGGSSLPTASTVPVKTTSFAGTNMSTFNACKVAQDGPSRNCGFSPSKSLVGTCIPGEDVTLNCKAGSTEIVTRICDGPDGCSHLSSLNLWEDSVCGPGVPSTTFTCGDDGAFAAMIGPATSGLAVGGSFASATGGTYPASELQVFFYEEGSFYGNLFKASEHESSVLRSVDAAGVITSTFLNLPGVQQNVFLDAFSCHDSNWTDAQAYFSHRLCAIDVVSSDGLSTSTLCAAKKLGACVGGPTPKCATGDVLPTGDGDNGGCRDDVGALRQRPLTTKLHQPCDLIPPGFEAVCERRDAR